MKNGVYYIDLTLTGGSGRAYIMSPAKLTVDNEKMTVELIWSSPNYDYMEVGGISYSPVNTTGNSVFTVQIDTLDADIPVKAQTVAMSEPHMIDYTLHFNSSTLKNVDNGLNPVIWICLGAPAIIGVIAAVFYRRRIHNEK